MRTVLACIVFGLAIALGGAAEAQLITFQNGVDGYNGTFDVELRTADATGRPSPEFPSGELPSAPFMSIDRNDGSVGADPVTGQPAQRNRTQGLMRFENIFVDEGGLVPRDQNIVFASVRFFLTSPTADGAVISLNRVLGEDQGSSEPESDRPDPDPVDFRPAGIWQDTDNWSTLGGSLVPVASPDNPELAILPVDPVEIGTETTLAVGNEALNWELEPLRTDPGDGRLAEPDNVLNNVFVEIPVTGSVRAWQEGAPNVGWAIDNTTTNGWDYVSADFAVDNPQINDPAGVQTFLDAFGLTEAEVRPQLRIVVGGAGDLNGDGVLDVLDFDILRDNLGNVYSGRGDLGDVDFDADVDLDDFATFKDLFNAANGAGAFEALATIPEPTALVIAGLAVAAVAARRER